MNVTKAINLVKYVADANGNKTDVLVPVEIWEAMLSAWKETIEQLEDREDLEVFQEWLQRRDTGLVETISLEDLEQELIADELLDELADDFNKSLGGNVPVLSDFAISREGIYEDHP